MNWRAKIYKNNKVAVIPINGADTAQEAKRCDEELLRKMLIGSFDSKACGKIEQDRIEIEQIG